MAKIKESNPIPAYDRRAKILEKLRVHQKVKVKDLKRAFDVSAMTIHRDLKDLQSEGLIKCVHGGAVFPQHTTNTLLFSKREVANADLKRAIAQNAIRHVKSGMSIFLDGSTTIVSLARLIREVPSLSIVTDSLSAFIELQRTHGIEVNILGGVLQGDENTVGGPIASKNVSEMYFDVCFFSAECFSQEGIYNRFPTGVEVKQLVVKRSQKVILLADSTKNGNKGVWKLCDWNSISLFITDDKLPSSFKEYLENHDCCVELASMV
jgi:DeoR/GlpR family transcriptional regulator of sugar metabolism